MHQSKSQAPLIGLVLLVGLASTCRCQIFDRLWNMRQTSGNLQASSNQSQAAMEMRPELGASLQNLIRNFQSVTVPALYEMTKNGSSMGINVLSGLVKVERGNEAERNGLAGPRPLSVRVFGVPVYERGQRVRPPSSDGGEPLLPGLLNFVPSNNQPNPKPTETESEEELPIES